MAGYEHIIDKEKVTDIALVWLDLFMGQAYIELNAIQEIEHGGITLGDGMFIRMTMESTLGQERRK